MHQLPGCTLDAGTVKTRLLGGFYTSASELRDAVHLTFDNAMIYNVAGAEVHECARKLKVGRLRSHCTMVSSARMHCANLLHHRAKCLCQGPSRRFLLRKPVSVFSVGPLRCCSNRRALIGSSGRWPSSS
eukprot:5208186-Pleurochrysis_carterae.AAC.1